MNKSRILPSLLLGATCALTSASCMDGLENSGNASAAATNSDRYIVSYKNAQGRAAVSNAGGVVALDLPGHGFLSANLPAAALNGLQNHPHIEFVEPDVKRYPSAVSEDQGFPDDDVVEVAPYGLAMVQADQVAYSTANGGRTLCIIDSGIDEGHVDHPARLTLTGTDDSGTGAWSTDENGHGTHVAGTVAGLANGGGVVGVNSGGNLNLHIIKVFGADGWAYSSSLVAALDACEAVGSDVVSMSLGGSFKSRSEDRAFAAAHSRGILSIAAAGNDGNTRKSYPASYDSVISVAAIDENSALASFSQRNSQVEISAPGVAVLSSVPRGTGSASVLDIGGYIPSAAMDESPEGVIVDGNLVDCGTGESTCSAAGGSVCLIQRGNISFADKVLACEAGGGSAAIIYNNEPGMLLGTMGGIETTIPSIGISEADGLALLGASNGPVNLSIAPTSWAFFDGTSMATPHVSAVAALVWSHDPTWTNDEIRDALNATAVDLGAAGRDDSFGYGLVQAKDALDYLGGSACTPSCPEEECGLVGDGCGGSCDADKDTCGMCGNADCCVPNCSGDQCGQGDGCGGSCDADIDTCGMCGNDECNACYPLDATCSTNSDCCSNKCKGKPNDKTCK